MLPITARFALALVPTLINAQSVTYSFTFGNVVTSVVLPSPTVKTTTITIQEPQTTLYLTTQIPQAITTQTIIITAPVDEISSIAGGIPKSYQDIHSEKPGDVVPFAINGYTTSIVIPASASIPTDITFPPFTPVIIPAATISAESAKAVSSLEALSSSLASENSAVASSITSKASEVVSKATSAISAESSAVTSLASSLKSKDITILPIPIPKPTKPSSILSSVESAISTKASSVLSSAESAISTKAAAASSDLSSIASKASTALSGVSSEISSASSAASHASTKIASISESARSKLSAATDSLTSILSDTALLSTETTSATSTSTSSSGLTTRTVSSTTATTESSSTATETKTATSSTTSSPSSTAAPASGAMPTARPVGALVLGFIGAVLFLG